MSARSLIVNALADVFKSAINGTTPYNTNLYGVNVSTKLKFWDEVSDFPYVCIVPGTEYREYLPGDFKWGMLNIAIKLYVYGENPNEQLEELIQDIEYAISHNENLSLADGRTTTEILITSIITDEGLLAPHGVGEVNVSVRYEV
jgi:hypothetical protein